MGRHSFEEKIKEKLSQREITPSAGSWEKISGQLNSENKKPAPMFWWIGIAATLIGGLFIAGMLYLKPATEAPGIVENPVEDFSKDDQTEPFIEQELVVEDNNKGTEDVKENPIERNIQPTAQLRGKGLVAEANGKNIPEKSDDILAEKEEIKISRKIEEIIADVSSKEDNAENPTYDEIDALLYKAASEISMERKSINSEGRVDAGDLLFAVEMELEESFREKVFELLKEGFLKARTAVANRSYP